MDAKLETERVSFIPFLFHRDNFRFEFQSHCGRLNTQLEYNQSRLEQEKKKCRKIEENVEKEERTANELKKVYR